MPALLPALLMCSHARIRPRVLPNALVHPANGEIIPIYPPIAKKPASDGRDQDDAKGGDADAEADGDSGDQEDDPLKRPYLVQGFAYHGSGKLVQRVELR